MTETASPVQFDTDKGARDGVCLMCVSTKIVWDVKITSTGKVATMCSCCGLTMRDLLTPAE